MCIGIAHTIIQVNVIIIIIRVLKPLNPLGIAEVECHYSVEAIEAGRSDSEFENVMREKVHCKSSTLYVLVADVAFHSTAPDQIKNGT